MSTFKQFLLEDSQSRTKTIDEQQALQFAETYCYDYLENGNYLYRGIYDRGHYLYGNSADSSPRIAKEIPNYYNLIMSNLPSWQQIPRRDQSFIGSTQIKGTKNYGDSFLMMIPDDTTVAAFHDKDIWSGTKNTEKVIGRDLDTIAFAIDRIHRYVDTNHTPQQTEHNFNNLVDFLNQAAKHIDQLSHKKEFGIERAAIQILELVQQKGAMDTLQYLFDPTGSVDTFTASNLPTLTENREVWFSGPAVFINVSDKHPHPREFIKQVL